VILLWLRPPFRAVLIAWVYRVGVTDVMARESRTVVLDGKVGVRKLTGRARHAC
jgi:hypothetical protein